MHGSVYLSQSLSPYIRLNLAFPSSQKSYASRIFLDYPTRFAESDSTDLPTPWVCDYIGSQGGSMIGSVFRISNTLLGKYFLLIITL
jgi:hypothetical protein